MISLKRLASLLYGSVASLPSPSSNNEAWPYGRSLRFASLLHSGLKLYVTTADYVIVMFDWRCFVYMYHYLHISAMCFCPIIFKNEYKRALKMNLITRCEWNYSVGLVNHLHSELLPLVFQKEKTLTDQQNFSVHRHTALAVINFWNSRVAIELWERIEFDVKWLDTFWIESSHFRRKHFISKFLEFLF